VQRPIQSSTGADPMHTTTPKVISPLVLSLCARLVPGAVPFFVPVKPAPDALPGESFTNVAHAVARFGGGGFHGWAISECADFLLAEFCAVWFTTCGTLDITPKPVGEQTILFLPDCKRVYEGNPVNDRIQPNNARGCCAALDRAFSGPPVKIVNVP
jgi:hypothetical protein